MQLVITYKYSTVTRQQSWVTEELKFDSQQGMRFFFSSATTRGYFTRGKAYRASNWPLTTILRLG
jgi:hypothetical protein